MSLAWNSSCLTGWVRQQPLQQRYRVIANSVCSTSCVLAMVGLPVLGIFNVRTDLIHVIAHGVCADTVRESALKFFVVVVVWGLMFSDSVFVGYRRKGLNVVWGLMSSDSVFVGHRRMGLNIVWGLMSSDSVFAGHRRIGLNVVWGLMSSDSVFVGHRRKGFNVVWCLMFSDSVFVGHRRMGLN